MGKGQPDKKGGQKRPAEEEAGPSKGAGSSSDKGLPTLDASPLEFLIAPLARPAFLETYFEKKPLLIKADVARREFFEGLFDYEALLALADKREEGEGEDEGEGEEGQEAGGGPLEFGYDINAARYVNGRRESPDDEVADSRTLRTLYEEDRCTFQLIQPQRFLDPLWRLMAALEAQLGCLAGCNAYLTPGGSQGLAPHHDDVELFVCQTRGSKRWRLYAPIGGFHLPSKSSEDLPQEALDDPLMDVVLEPGDVLYMPRGTVHQAAAQEGGSCHLTLSTYQRWTFAQLAMAVMATAGTAQDEQFSLPLELRRGLPFGHIFHCGLQADALLPAGYTNPASKAAAKALAEGLRKLAAKVEADPAALVSPTTDSLASDFLRNRLPPHPSQLPETGPLPSARSALVCRGHNLFMLVPVQGGNSDSDDDDEDGSDEGGDGEEEDEGEEGGGGKAGKRKGAAGGAGAGGKAKGKGAQAGEKDDDKDQEDEEEEGAEEDEEEEEAMVQLVTCLVNRRETHMMPRRPGGDDDEHGHDHCHDEHCHDPGHDHGHRHGHGSDLDEVEGASDGGGGEGEESSVHKKKKKQALHHGGGHDHAHGHGHGHGKKHGKGGKQPGGSTGDAEAEAGGDEGDEEGDHDEGSGDDEMEVDDTGLPGPVFPAAYTVALADVLAATHERPLPVAALRVPGSDPEEQLRLAQTLWAAGYVVTVPSPMPPAKDKEGGGGKAKKAKK